MSTPSVATIIELLGHRELEAKPARRSDGAAVWRATVRSVRRVVWCAEDSDLGRVLESLVGWLEADAHRTDCRCRICCDRLAAEAAE